MAMPFDVNLYHSLTAIGRLAPRLKWYLTAVVALGALNYPEEIPKLYTLLLSDHIPKPDQKSETSKMREGLTKVCGIHGAAKTGSALRALATATPPELADSTYHRAGDTREEAIRRGAENYSSIYDNIPGYDSDKTLNASPDYYHIVRGMGSSSNFWTIFLQYSSIPLVTELFYGHIFSFTGVLDNLETGQVVVAALLGIDCHEQARNHMLGMLMRGASHEDLVAIRSIVVSLAEHYGVKFKHPSMTIPILETSTVNQ
ncbi:uncharacterized protein N7477_005262 [Penicillium maclennaniae]|uniref:uncharacterized protein n=1 Tax=Penicillium maclennaniae TaxID=1343394 RepID=UPI00254192C8|nr:uncharacterized protein N7477_005262 [Penicillium maclennaniae]KAJ5669899.1 hypothetical protein N7477_005262 [Penicillium maclennaniae]